MTTAGRQPDRPADKMGFMPTVSALYRYPVKGFTPEPREQLTIGPDGRVAGDRVLAFRFASAVEPEDYEGLPYWPKRRGLSLMGFASLARLRLRLDDGVLHIADDGELLVEAGLDEAGRALIAERLTRWLRTTSQTHLLDRPGVEPLVLVGDGETSRFQDRAEGFVSVHGEGSTRALQAVLPGGGDERRFRSNVVVSGIPAWQELNWRGRLRIGEVELEVIKPIGRCLATHANPDTGERDADVMPALVKNFDQQEPTMGVLLLPADAGGTIRLGDEVRID